MPTVCSVAGGLQGQDVGSVVFVHEGGPAPAQAPLEYVREYHAVNPRVAPSLRLGVGRQADVARILAGMPSLGEGD